MTEPEFREYVQARVDETCGSTAALARKLKVHPKSLTIFLSGARGCSADLAAAFGFERQYVPMTPTPSPTSEIARLNPQEQEA